jgi:uncharacterized protein YbjQ (UPF0145 family)
LSDDKRDLTRIEDLGEFIHELNADEEENIPEDFSSELPDLPSSEADPFGSTFDSPSEDEEAFATSFEDESPADLNSEGTTDFGTSDFTTSFEQEAQTPEDESPSWMTEETSPDEYIENDDPFASSDSSEDELASLYVDNAETQTQLESELIDPDPIMESTPIMDSQEFTQPETFEDLKKFSENSSFSGMATEGNPSFSVLIKNVRFIEDINDIISLLRELTLLVDTEEQVKSRLMRGMLLVPRVSEYAAIFLAHKLRRFDIDIQVGLSDEIHPPKHQETPETGIVSKFNLFQNQAHHFHFDDPKLELSQIIVAATPSLEGHQVLRYMGVASEHKMLDSQIVEDENSDEVPRHYQELAQKLKAHALKAHANAVVGLNYQLTPIPSEFGMGGHKYRLTCTGNLVWVNKL